MPPMKDYIIMFMVVLCLVGIGLEEDRTDTSFTSVSSREQSFFSSLFSSWLCYTIYLAFEMDIHCLIFIERNILERKN